MKCYRKEGRKKAEMIEKRKNRKGWNDIEKKGEKRWNEKQKLIGKTKKEGDVI